MATGKVSTVPSCSYCTQQHTVKLRRQVASNGRVDFMWYCLDCKRPAVKGKPFLRKTLIEFWMAQGRLKSPDSVPVVGDYSDTVFCEVCGAAGAEWHHWLPQCFAPLVKNFFNWPTAYLCKPCHDFWHETVTPFLPGRGKTEEGKRTIEKYKIRG